MIASKTPRVMPTSQWPEPEPALAMRLRTDEKTDDGELSPFRLTETRHGRRISAEKLAGAGPNYSCPSGRGASLRCAPRTVRGRPFYNNGLDWPRREPSSNAQGDHRWASGAGWRAERKPSWWSSARLDRGGTVLAVVRRLLVSHVRPLALSSDGTKLRYARQHTDTTYAGHL